MKAESHTKFFPSYIITLQARATVEARRVFCFVFLWMNTGIIRIIIIMCFLLLVVMALICQCSTTWILWTSAACSDRDSGQQLHVQLFGSTALLKQPLLFASALTAQGMEKSVVLFPCHQQVQFTYVQSWQNLCICCIESPVLKETGINIKCTWDSSLFILVGAFVALLIEKWMVWCYLRYLFCKLQFELWVTAWGWVKVELDPGFRAKRNAKGNLTTL